MEVQFDYSLEKRLKELNADFSKRYTSSMFLFEILLKKYTAAFPDFTDHTLFHAVNVLNFANHILGEAINDLNVDEIYCFMMAVATHDVGMGTSDEYFDDFAKNFGIQKYWDEHSDKPKTFIIRKFHNDFSYQFVMKLYHLFDIPDETYASAIARIGQGHRSYDLTDKELFPETITVSSGNTIRLPMLCALLRFADELDIGSDRNPDLLYGDFLNHEHADIDILHFKRHKSVDNVDVDANAVVINGNTKYPEVKFALDEILGDVIGALELYIELSKMPLSFKATQREVILNYGDETTHFPAKIS